jgi:hypothetical protein
MKFLDSLPPPTETELQQFEAQIGALLPLPYRQFLLQYNGAQPDPKDIQVPKWGATFLRSFYALGPAGSQTLRHYHQLFQDRIPKAFIPIISDAAGNVFVLGISGKYTGQIWFWYHEGESDDGEKPTFRNMYKVAPHFQAFLDQLYEYKEPEQAYTPAETLAKTGEYPILNYGLPKATISMHRSCMAKP